MVFPNVETVAVLTASCDAGTRDFGKTVNIVGDNAGFTFDRLAHLVCPRLGAENTVLQLRVLPEVHTLLLGFFDYAQEVARSGCDCGYTEVAHEHDLPFRVSAGDDGRVLENIVFLELMRRHRNVYTVVTRNGFEIDFVTRDGDDIRYYQVSESVKSPETLERELRPLKEIGDNYPKFLVTADYGKPVMHDGIRQISIYDFLRQSS